MVVLAPGANLLGGRARLTKLLARGPNANTWAAESDVGPIVVKEQQAGLSAELAARFRREQGIVEQLVSPFLAPFVGAGSLEDGRTYFAVRAFAGLTLEEHLRQGPVAPARLRSVALAILRALDAVHAAGFVHRDVHPGNVWILREGSPAALLLDLGAASSSSEDGLTSTTGFLGTYRYSAPEQLFAAATVDGRADLYALGCWVYQGLTGFVPLVGPSAEATLSLREAREAPALGVTAGRAFAPETQAFVAGLLARDPAARFASASVAIARLPKVLA